MSLTGNDHWLYFGDGNAAKIIESKDYLNKETGKKYVRFILVPSDLIKEMYDIKDKIDPNTNMIFMEYHWSKVIWLQRGVHRSRCWVLTDFMGGETPASRWVGTLSSDLEDTERLLRGTQAAKHRVYYELEMEQLQQHKKIAGSVKVLRELAKARGRVSSEEEGEMETEEN